MKKKFLISGFLSFILPGAGQYYNNNKIFGLLLLIITILGYIYILPIGVVSHIFAFSDAMIDKNKIKKENLYMFS